MELASLIVIVRMWGLSPSQVLPIPLQPYSFIEFKLSSFPG
jgi:hypothetical protein